MSLPAPNPAPRRDWRKLAYELLRFGSVGAVAFVVDAGLFNLLVHGPGTILGHKPVTAKVISVALSIIVAWVGNRYWTFADKRNQAIGKELVSFVVVNLGGLLISAGCLWFSRYVLHQDSALADNIAGTFIGTGLGTIFRYFAYKFFVFRGDQGGAGGGAGRGAAPAGSASGGVPAPDAARQEGPNRARPAERA